MKLPIFTLLLVFASPFALHATNNCVVNLSHYDLMHPDFVGMKNQGVMAVIHEATYPRYQQDSRYRERHAAAMQAGLLWGAYHFGDATNPVTQADHFLDVVASSIPHTSTSAKDERRPGVLLVLDFEKNGHYPGGTMRTDQAAAFVERIHDKTGVYPGVYCSENRIRQMLGAPGVSASQRRSLTNCWLWVANYHFQPRNTAPWDDWMLWQYTGDGKCDLPRASYPRSVANIRKAERNIFRGNTSTLENFWQTHSWHPQG